MNKESEKEGENYSESGNESNAIRIPILLEAIIF